MSIRKNCGTERSRIALTHEAEIQELRNHFASLTPRERQVMALVVSGLLNKQIGGELGISEITVKAHREREGAFRGWLVRVLLDQAFVIRRRSRNRAYSDVPGVLPG